MDRMLVVVFDNEAKAHEGEEVLLQLNAEGSISVYGYAVVAKHADGTVTVKRGNDDGPLGTQAATSLGSFIRRLGGPTDLDLEAAAGATADLSNARIGEDFIEDVTKVLLPNRVAVVAEVAEEWTVPVDNRMEPIGGIIFRWTLSELKHT